jgi:hypothetical protein
MFFFSPYPFGCIFLPLSGVHARAVGGRPRKAATETHQLSARQATGGRARQILSPGSVRDFCNKESDGECQSYVADFIAADFIARFCFGDFCCKESDEECESCVADFSAADFYRRVCV